MKIAIVRQRYNPYGGAERFVERALAALAAEGSQITLITRSWAGAPAEGFRQITCDPPYSRFIGGRVARERSFASAVQQEWARGDYDITQSHERIPGCQIFRAGDGVHAAWLAHRARDLGTLGRWGQAFSGFHRYVLATERAMFGDSRLRKVICNSRMVAEELQSFYGLAEDQLALIYNGVDTSVFHPGLADTYRETTRLAAGIPMDATVFLYVGSGFERKGVPRLLSAFSRAALKNSYLVIVGADRKAAALQARAQALGLGEHVKFTGPLKDVRPWYGAADAFVLPTLYDPGPNAALEAMASGLPLLTSLTCGARDWVREGENGYLVDAGSEEQILEALRGLQYLAADPAAHLAARRAVEALTLPAMAGRLLDLYRGLAT